MRDLVYYKKTRTLLNKREDFDYLLAHFHELTGRDETGIPYTRKLCITLDDRVDHIAGICEEFMGGGRRLTDEERARLETFIERQLRKEERMSEEMDNMRALEWKAWYQHLEDGNWHHFDSYALDYRIEVWEEFKERLEWD
ncbi:hypothetical protein HK104_000257 [Borealophlyctis nickersoniae]|nr:hypothetical protein HK104_000257 [Borealophlyctis nickersoniae]